MKFADVLTSLATAAIFLVPISGLAQSARDASKLQYKPGIVIEAEALSSEASANAGMLDVQAMQGFGMGWGGNAQLLWTGGSVGAVLDLPFSVANAGSYAVSIFLTRAADYADLELEINGQIREKNAGGFSNTVSAPSAVQLGVQAMRAGQNVVSVKIIGKDARSSGYLVGIDRILLTPATSGPSTATVRNLAATNARAVIASGSAGNGGRAIVSSGSAGKGDLDCPTTCNGNVSSIFRKTDAGACKLWFRFACTPYNCDEAAGLCQEYCQNDRDCAQGSACATTTGLCAAVSAMCIDAFAIRMPNGQVQSCDPYKCRSGACQNVCSSHNDCAKGYSCNVNDGTCLPAGK